MKASDYPFDIVVVQYNEEGARWDVVVDEPKKENTVYYSHEDKSEATSEGREYAKSQDKSVLLVLTKRDNVSEVTSYD